MSGEERSKNSSEDSGRVAGLENLGTTQNAGVIYVLNRCFEA